MFLAWLFGCNSSERSDAASVRGRVLELHPTNVALTRHGAAVMSLVNDRWRTDQRPTTDDTGAVELQATLGDYLARWTDNGDAREARFVVERGASPLRVVIVDPDETP